MAGTHRPLRHREGRLVRRLVRRPRTLANDVVVGNLFEVVCARAWLGD